MTTKEHCPVHRELGHDPQDTCCCGKEKTTNHPEGSLEEDIEGLIKRIEKYVNDNVEDRDFQRHWLKAHLEIFSRKERKQHGDKRYEKGVRGALEELQYLKTRPVGAIASKDGDVIYEFSSTMFNKVEEAIQALIPKEENPGGAGGYRKTDIGGKGGTG